MHGNGSSTRLIWVIADRFPILDWLDKKPRKNIASEPYGPQ